MILDFLSAIGHIPTAGLNWTAADLLDWADRCGTDVLLVEALDNLLRRDGKAHEDLLAACHAHPHRLLPAATIDLKADDLGLRTALTARDRGFAAVVLRGRIFSESRLLPDVLNALRAKPLPIVRPVADAGEWDTLARLADDWPDLSFVLIPRSFDGTELTHRLAGLPNAYFAMAHSLTATGQLEKAVGLMGAGRILYAGDFPHQHPARPLGLIFDADLGEPERETLLSGAALTLLRRHGIEVPDTGRPTRKAVAPCRIVDPHGHLGGDAMRIDYDASTGTMLGYLDRAGVDVLYVSSVEAVYGDVVWGNDFIAREVARHPTRFRGYAVANPWEGRACLDEIKRCYKLGFAGLKPYPPVFKHELADRIMDPVWDLVESMGWPALCHSRADNDLRRVLERRPKARLIMAHMTSGWREKAELAREFPNAVFEISGAGETPQAIAESLEIAGPENLVFGSDLCTHPVGYTLYPLLCSGIPDDMLCAILRDNALRYFAR